MQIKKILCLLLCLTMFTNLMVGCGNQEQAESTSTATESVEIEAVTSNPEIETAMELFEIPAGWEEDLSAAADFAGFSQIMESLISLWGEAALNIWRTNVDSTAFPDRTMLRDDGLVLLMLGAEALGFNVYNARDYGFCTENLVNYDTISSQLSWDYPYCDSSREIKMFFGEYGGDEDPIGDVVSSAIFWMQRRMDLSQQVHFLDSDEDLNFHLDLPFTREAAIASVVRLYNSEMLEYDPSAALQQELSIERKAILAESEDRIEAILNNDNELPCEGTAYYVSNSGNDQNDGLSPETAWQTLKQVNSADLKSGDGVYFERGNTWRGQLWAQNGVIYSAYGEGAKPNIYGSPENGANSNKWLLLEGTDNIWVYHMDMMDCGILVFNDGESWGTKVAPYYMNGYLSTINDGQPFDVRTELTSNLMFFSEADSILYDGAPFRYNVMDTCDYNEYGDVVGTLYLRCDEGNPGEVFDSIEFAVRENIVLPADDVVFHNLCLKYTGVHGIFGVSMGYDVSFCEIGWIGGSPQYYRYDTGEPVLLGNGVECDGSYDHYSVTDCYIYQCFDAGVSNQDPSESPEVTGQETDEYCDVIQQNITYARNVFAYNDMPIEIFFSLEDNAGYGRHIMQNVLIEENFFLYTGYGWASIRNNKAQYSSAYMGHDYPNASENFSIRNNVFFLCTGPLLTTGAKQEWLPVLDGNTYVQTEGGTLALWTGDDGVSVRYGYHENTAESIIKDILGDENGKLVP